MKLLRSSSLAASLVCAATLFVIVPSAWAQRIKPPATPAAAQKKAAPPAKRKGQKTDPLVLDLRTVDDVVVAATYFPSDLGQNAAVVVLLHGYQETQDKMWELAGVLNDNGYAVMTFDFRGHGYSTVVGTDGSQTISFRDLGRRVSIETLLLDIDAVRNYLVQRNNAGELNLSKLALVGSEMGANLAILWAYADWQKEERIGFQDKQAHDVQALVLISPPFNFRGLTVQKELASISEKLPIQVVVGKADRKAFNDGQKMHQISRRALPEDSVLESIETSLQGTKLLDPSLKLEVNEKILTFLNKNLRSRGNPWERHEIQAQ